LRFLGGLGTCFALRRGSKVLEPVNPPSRPYARKTVGSKLGTIVVRDVRVGRRKVRRGKDRREDGGWYGRRGRSGRDCGGSSSTSGLLGVGDGPRATLAAVRSPNFADWIDYAKSELFAGIRH
jgi:hypothetical protein